MSKYVRFRTVLVLAGFVAGILARNIRTREKIYIDILKNFTNVNNILKDLFNSYTDLKSVYEAHERTENELTIDTSSENVFEDEAKVKYRKTSRNYTGPDSGEHFYPVTQMILLDEGSPNDSNDKSKEDYSTKEKHGEKSAENHEIASIDTNIVADSNNEPLADNKFIKKNQPTPILSNKPKMIIIGQPVDRYENNLPDFAKKDFKSKTRFNKVSNTGRFNFQKGHIKERKSPPLLRNGNYADFGNIITDDGYSQYRTNNITELTQWNGDNQILFNAEKRPKIKSSPSHKTVIVFIINKRTEQEKDKTRYKNKSEYDSIYVQDDILINDKFKTTLLRDNYGAACLRVAVRKCYKTLLQTRRIVCGGGIICKESFKQHFNAHSKTGCIKQFNYVKNDGGQANSKSDQNSLKTQKDELAPNIYDGDVFQDVTRSATQANYFSLCLPIIMSEITDKNDNNNNNRKTEDKPVYRDSNRTRPINVLRDHYEMECGRMSSDRCKRACRYAIDETCKQSYCVRKERLRFIKTCLRQCKLAFLPNNRSGNSDSDSDSDTSNDSDSSDDSDSDLFSSL